MSSREGRVTVAEQVDSLWDEIQDLRYKNHKLQMANSDLLQANRDCLAWFDAINADLQKALKALDTLARLGAGGRYGTSTGNWIAQNALDQIIGT
jgi:hypothetical protein